MAERKNEAIDMYDFPVYDCTQEQNGSPLFVLSFDNVNGHVCQLERFLRSRNFATMVMWRNTSLYYTNINI